MRPLLVLLVLVGLMLPRLGAALGEMAGLETVVICRGDALVTVTLGADGAPVETAGEDHGPCLAALPAASPARNAAARTVAFEKAPPALRGAPPAPRAPWHGPPPGRAPPA